ncbi:Mak10 subunit, NatC N-terminal acetyltransferase-domain-containing protein [Peziza echinospora]|nr:Mak10 subunit, NatC N-terminal acetyltransferase-domain-containing protein [Peziza echinospora]
MDGADLSDGFQRLDVNDGSGGSPSEHEDSPTRPASDYTDITERFFNESCSLLIGQLVQDPNFTLLDAIMDPKMDSGLMPAITEEHFNMAWHNGSSLGQTVFICLYVDNLLQNAPRSLEKAIFTATPPAGQTELDVVLLKVLRAYCLGVVKCCGLVNWTILSQFTLEEEDFVTQTYDIALLDVISADALCRELAITSSLFVESEHTKDLPEDIRRAIVDRIDHRISMLRAFSLTVEDYNKYKENPLPPWEECSRLTDVITETTSLGKPVVEAFSTYVQRKLATTVPPRPEIQLPFDEATKNLKRTCKDMSEIVNILHYISPANTMNFLMRFTTRRITPSTYVRCSLQCLLVQNWMVVGKIHIKEYIMDDIRELTCPIPELFDPLNDAAEAPQSAEYNISRRKDWFLEKAMNLILGLFQRLCMNRPRVRRSLCHALVEFDTFQSSAEKIDSDLRQFTNEPPLLGLDSEDEETFQYPLSSWVFHYKLKIMELVVLLGFELEIYQPYEYAGMYWQVQQYIRSHLQHLERIKMHVIPRSASRGGNVPGEGAGAGGETEEYKSQRVKTANFLSYLLLETSAMHDLVSALLNTHRLTLSLGLVLPPPQPYSTPELRFLLRMKPFRSLSVPEPFEWESSPWEFFQRNEMPDPEDGEARGVWLGDIKDTLDEATQFVADARKHYDLLARMRLEVCRAELCEEMHRTNIKDTLRSCIATSIAISELAKIVAEEEEEKGPGEGKGKKAVDETTAPKKKYKVTIDTAKYHSWFPVPVVAQVE